MARKTQLEKAIENVDREIEVLQATRARLVKQHEDEQAKKAAKAGAQ